LSENKQDKPMKDIIRRIISPRWDARRAAAAGFAATVAYSIEMEGDMSLTGNRFSDVRFIDGLLTGKANSRERVPVLAWIIHLANGVLLGEVYAAVLKRFLPGPDWLKGAIFGELFIVSAWWLVPVADEHHPMIKSGELPRLASWTSFLQNIVRHLVFGLALGLLYRDKREEAYKDRA
jgi:hypothetical protein